MFCQSRLSTEVAGLDQEGRRGQDGDSHRAQPRLPARRREGSRGCARATSWGKVRARSAPGIDISHLDVAVLAGYPAPSRHVAAGRARAGGGRVRRGDEATSSRWTSTWPRIPITSSGRRPSTPINPENYPDQPRQVRGLRAADQTERPSATCQACPRWRTRACFTGQATLHRARDLPGRPHLAAHRHLDNFWSSADLRRGRSSGARCRGGGLEERLRHDLPEGDLHAGGDPFRSSTTRTREKVAYVSGWRWFTSPTRSAPGRLDPSARAAGDARPARRAGRVLVAEKVVGFKIKWARWRTWAGRGGAAAAGDADHQRLALHRAARRDLPAPA